MKLPKTIVIKGKTWRVFRRWGLTLNGHKVYGLCDAEERIIVLDNCLTRDEVLKTFLHELNHAILHELGVWTLNADFEEVIVEGFADVYTDLFKIKLL